MKLSNARTSIFLISLCSYYLYPSAAEGKLCIGAIPDQTEVIWRAQTKATKVIQKNEYKILQIMELAGLNEVANTKLKN